MVEKLLIEWGTQLALNLLHLSDIHFKCEIAGTIHDLDDEIRNELIIDVHALAQSTGPIDAVLVTGDIAFAGKPDDYAVAQDWLKDLCARVGCKAKDVWVVPGNHDIDRDLVSHTVRSIQTTIRSAIPSEIDNEIRKFLHDDEPAAEMLASPMSEYRKFAAIYGCAVQPTALAWQSELPLSDDCVVKLVGLNSALVSNDEDDDENEEKKLLIGRAQLHLPRSPGVVYVTLCHHPVSWLRDAETVAARLRNRAAIQLYGHVHRHEVLQDSNTLVVQAGALHPDRGEKPWYPSYNLLRLTLNSSANDSCLDVTVYPRVWSEDEVFVADNSVRPAQCESFSLPINMPEPDGTLTGSALPATKTSDDADTIVSEEEVIVSYGMKDPSKQLVYGFLTLPYTKQVRIAEKLELLGDDDAGLESSQFFDRILHRAKEKTLLYQLWEAINTENPNLEMETNPFNSETEARAN